MKRLGPKMEEQPKPRPLPRASSMEKPPSPKMRQPAAPSKQPVQQAAQRKQLPPLPQDQPRPQEPGAFQLSEKVRL